MNYIHPWKDLGDFLTQVRKSKRLTQRELARKIGYSQSYIDKIERGRQRGSFNALHKISIALDLEPSLVLQKAALANIGYTSTNIAEFSSEFDLETHEFAKLSPKVKKFLLKIAEAAGEYTES